MSLRDMFATFVFFLRESHIEVINSPFLRYLFATYGSAKPAHALRTTGSYWMSSAGDAASDEREGERASERAVFSSSCVSDSHVNWTQMPSQKTHEFAPLLYSVTNFCSAIEQRRIMRLYQMSEHVESLFARLAAVGPSSL